MSDMSGLCAMTSEGGDVREAALSVMSRAHTREIAPSDLVVDGWAVGWFFVAGEDLRADSTAVSCYQDRFMGKGGLKQTVLLLSLMAQNCSKIDPKEIMFFNCYFKTHRMLLPLGMLFPASTGTRIAPTVCRVGCEDFSP